MVPDCVVRMKSSRSWTMAAPEQKPLNEAQIELVKILAEVAVENFLEELRKEDGERTDQKGKEG